MNLRLKYRFIIPCIQVVLQNFQNNYTSATLYSLYRMRREKFREVNCSRSQQGNISTRLGPTHSGSGLASCLLRVVGGGPKEMSIINFFQIKTLLEQFQVHNIEGKVQRYPTFFLDNEGPLSTSLMKKVHLLQLMNLH